MHAWPVVAVCNQETLSLLSLKVWLRERVSLFVVVAIVDADSTSCSWCQKEEEEESEESKLDFPTQARQCFFFFPSRPPIVHTTGSRFPPQLTPHTLMMGLRISLR